jgi:transcriptional regulator with XRE-family HTH domain
MTRLDKLYSQIGDRISKVREKRKLTQEDLAINSELSRTSLVQIENGKQRITLDRLYKVAQALQEDVKTFLPSMEEIFEPNLMVKEVPVTYVLDFKKDEIEKLKNLALGEDHGKNESDATSNSDTRKKHDRRSSG